MKLTPIATILVLGAALFLAPASLAEPATTSNDDSTSAACPTGNVCCQYSAVNCYCTSDSGERDCTDSATRAPCTSSLGATPTPQVGQDCDFNIVLPEITSTQASTTSDAADACPTGNVCCQYSAVNCYCSSDSGERDCTDDATGAPCTTSLGATPYPQVGADCDFGAILRDFIGPETSTTSDAADACPTGNVCCQYSAVNCYCSSDSGERDCTDDATGAPCTTSLGATPYPQVGADCDFGIILPDLETKASSHSFVGKALDVLRHWF